MDATSVIDRIIELDATIMKLQDSFEDLPHEDRLHSLSKRQAELQAGLNEQDELPPALVRVVEMICTLDGAPGLLVTGLSHSNESVRSISGEALISLGNEDGVQSIVPAVDYALEKLDTSAREMPFILGLIEDNASLDLIHRFLRQDDQEIVYSAIEACAHVADMNSIEFLKELVDDEREIADEDEETVTVGMLASEAIDIIEALD